VKEWDETRQENGFTISQHFLEYKGRRLWSETRQELGNTKIKKLLSNPEDLEFYASLPVNLDPGRIERELNAQMPLYLQEMAEFPIELGSMMLDIGEPVGPLYHDSQLEEYSIWSLTHSDLVVDLLDRIQQQKRIFYRYCLERDLADVYFLVGSELASPPLVSRPTFLKWIVPYATELIEMIHSYDKKVIQHYHGQIKRILPDFLTMKPDALHTIEAPPVGNCTFTEAFNVVGDQIALIGNIQYDEFRRFTPEEMASEVRKVLAECQGKRLILSPSAGPYEEELSPRQVENYLAFLQAGWEG
jgi:uroporphyrinogen-III decarboxylase